jgi:hypothetical protein
VKKCGIRGVSCECFASKCSVSKICINFLFASDFLSKFFALYRAVCYSTCDYRGYCCVLVSVVLLLQCTEIFLNKNCYKMMYVRMAMVL